MVLAANAASEWAQVAVTLLLGVGGVIVGLSIRQKQRQEMAVTVAQKRFAAYAALWAKIPYSPELLRLKHRAALGSDELETIFDDMTAWYYEGGQGMLLGPQTRAIYLTVKTNLICSEAEFKPLPQQTLTPAERSRLCVRQLSLLRSAMRADLEIYGEPWGKKIDVEDRAFLDACDVSPLRLEHGVRERLRLVRGRVDPPEGRDAATI